MLVWLTADSPEKWRRLVDGGIMSLWSMRSCTTRENYCPITKVQCMSEPYSHISEEDVEVHRGGPVGPWDSLSSSSLFPHQAARLGDTRKVFKRGDAKAGDNLHVWYSVPTLSLVTE